MTHSPPPDAEALYARLRELVRAWLAAQDTPPTLVGVYSGGAWLAERLHEDLALPTPLGVVSSTLHRDDFGTRGLHPSGNRTELPFEVNARSILLVDDVLYTGRTIRAAINELYDFGRPARIDLAVLIDRGGRELPICASLVGATVELPPRTMLALERDPAAGPRAMRLAYLESES
jgi:pyrimidine operon attenuation protein/uracil phosphoribosyltransferase